MYAIVKTGGKQYTVQIDDIVKVEKINANPGDKITLDQVLAVGDKGQEAIFGTPIIEGATVECEFIGDKSDKKVLVFKMKRRKSYRRLQGHRQKQSIIKITSINAK